MLTTMLRSIKNFEVLYSIIIFIVVLMMHHLITIKNSTKMILHRNPVKQNIPILRSEGMLWH